MKTLLVSLAHLNRVDDVINVAAYIARQHDSHVVGYYPVPGPTIVAITHPGAYVPLDDRIQQMYESKAAEIRSQFEDRMKRDGINFEWRQERLTVSDVTSALIDHGRESDLIIVSKQEETGARASMDMHLAADIVMSAGRPVLIVPPLDGQNVSFAKTVIGWNASRESCRATFDSLPILKNASDVHLTWVNPEKSLGKVGKLPGTELGAALARHDVTVTTKGLSNRSKPGVALLSYVKEQNAGLLVMGAYGHSRIRERILGGATEYVLKNTKTPVLMSN